MKEPGTLIWRVDQRSLVVMAGMPGIFRPEDAYIVLVTTQSQTNTTTFHQTSLSRSLVSEIFLWLGAATSSVEQGVASVVAVELDEMLGGGWVIHREVQGHESGQFCHVFDNVLEYLPARSSEPESGGSSLLSIEGEELVCRTSVVALAASSVRASGVFVLDQGSRLILWPGPASSDRARARAMTVCMRRRQRGGGGGVAEVSIAEPSTAAAPGTEGEFWAALGGMPAGGLPRVERVLPLAERVLVEGGATALQLWQLSEVTAVYNGRKKLQVLEMAARGKPLRRELLSSTESFLLVSGARLWVWVGREAVTGERQKAMLYAQSFLQGKGLPLWTPVTRIVEGAEPAAFTACFDAWRTPLSRADDAGASTPSVAAAGGPTAAPRRGDAEVHRNAEARRAPAANAGTAELVAWQLPAVEEDELVPLAACDVGQFSCTRAYLVRHSWRAAGARRHVLYTWHGTSSAAAAERSRSGAAAAAAEAAEEMAERALSKLRLSLRPEHVSEARLHQGLEPADFVALFGGGLFVIEPERAAPRHHLGSALHRVHARGGGDGGLCVEVRCEA